MEQAFRRLLLRGERLLFVTEVIHKALGGKCQSYIRLLGVTNGRLIVPNRPVADVFSLTDCTINRHVGKDKTLQHTIIVQGRKKSVILALRDDEVMQAVFFACEHRISPYLTLQIDRQITSKCMLFSDFSMAYRFLAPIRFHYTDGVPTKNPVFSLSLAMIKKYMDEYFKPEDFGDTNLTAQCRNIGVLSFDKVEKHLFEKDLPSTHDAKSVGWNTLYRGYIDAINKSIQERFADVDLSYIEKLITLIADFRHQCMEKAQHIVRELVIPDFLRGLHDDASNLYYRVQENSVVRSRQLKEFRRAAKRRTKDREILANNVFNEIGPVLGCLFISNPTEFRQMFPLASKIVNGALTEEPDGTNTMPYDIYPIFPARHSPTYILYPDSCPPSCKYTVDGITYTIIGNPARHTENIKRDTVGFAASDDVYSEIFAQELDATEAFLKGILATSEGVRNKALEKIHKLLSIPMRCRISYIGFVIECTSVDFANCELMQGLTTTDEGYQPVRNRLCTQLTTVESVGYKSSTDDSLAEVLRLVEEQGIMNVYEHKICLTSDVHPPKVISSTTPAKVQILGVQNVGTPDSKSVYLVANVSEFTCQDIPSAFVAACIDAGTQITENDMTFYKLPMAYLHICRFTVNQDAFWANLRFTGFNDVPHLREYLTQQENDCNYIAGISDYLRYVYVPFIMACLDNMQTLWIDSCINIPSEAMHIGYPPFNKQLACVFRTCESDAYNNGPIMTTAYGTYTYPEYIPSLLRSLGIPEHLLYACYELSSNPAVKTAILQEIVAQTLAQMIGRLLRSFVWKVSQYGLPSDENTAYFFEPYEVMIGLFATSLREFVVNIFNIIFGFSKQAKTFYLLQLDVMAKKKYFSHIHMYINNKPVNVSHYEKPTVESAIRPEALLPFDKNDLWAKSKALSAFWPSFTLLLERDIRWNTLTPEFVFQHEDFINESNIRSYLAGKENKKPSRIRFLRHQLFLRVQELTGLMFADRADYDFSSVSPLKLSDFLSCKPIVQYTHMPDALRTEFTLDAPTWERTHQKLLHIIHCSADEITTIVRPLALIRDAEAVAQTEQEMATSISIPESAIPMLHRTTTTLLHSLASMGMCKILYGITPIRGIDSNGAGYEALYRTIEALTQFYTLSPLLYKHNLCKYGSIVQLKMLVYAVFFMLLQSTRRFSLEGVRAYSLLLRTHALVQLTDNILERLYDDAHEDTTQGDRIIELLMSSGNPDNITGKPPGIVSRQGNMYLSVSPAHNKLLSSINNPIYPLTVAECYQVASIVCAETFGVYSFPFISLNLEYTRCLYTSGSAASANSVLNMSLRLLPNIQTHPAVSQGLTAFLLCHSVVSGNFSAADTYVDNILNHFAGAALDYPTLIQSLRKQSARLVENINALKSPQMNNPLALSGGMEGSPPQEPPSERARTLKTMLAFNDKVLRLNDAVSNQVMMLRHDVVTIKILGSISLFTGESLDDAQLAAVRSLIPAAEEITTCRAKTLGARAHDTLLAILVLARLLFLTQAYDKCMTTLEYILDLLIKQEVEFLSGDGNAKHWQVHSRNVGLSALALLAGSVPSILTEFELQDTLLAHIFSVARRGWGVVATRDTDTGVLTIKTVIRQIILTAFASMELHKQKFVTLARERLVIPVSDETSKQIIADIYHAEDKFAFIHNIVDVCRRGNDQETNEGIERKNIDLMRLSAMIQIITGDSITIASTHRSEKVTSSSLAVWLSNVVKI